jgi:radical SAM protein with 4Fe4S-binding SPASM domain
LGRGIGICFNAVPQNINQLHDLVSSLLTTYRIPIRKLTIQRIIPSGANANTLDFGLRLDDIEPLMRQVDQIAAATDIPIMFEDPVPLCIVDPNHHKYLARCEWGYTRGAISPTGFLTRCAADDHYRFGSIWSDHLQKIWADHPILQSFRSQEYLPAECKACALLDRCGGGCALSCGTLTDHGVDRLYTQRTNRP